MNKYLVSYRLKTGIIVLNMEIEASSVMEAISIVKDESSLVLSCVRI
jgi:hypothetical protein